MLFNSLEFAFFLPVVFILYWRIPGKDRWLLLLLASYYFYMRWNWIYSVLILGVTLITFCGGLFIEKYFAEGGGEKRRIVLYGALTANLGILFFFKYFNFVSENFFALTQNFSDSSSALLLDIVLPVGISFYIFQAMSYIIDVYKGNMQVEHHFGKFAAYISFFPQLVAGPIERTENLLPQIKTVKDFDYDNAVYGLKKIVWGYFKKIVIADTLAVDINRVYSSLHSYTGFALIIVAVFFSIQIYCDFSGYSDIAIGTAKLFNINLMENFKSPYFSTSIKEFWMRWHISLSSWFSDYVYIPLGGNRCGNLRAKLNIVITFLLSGLWHGAAWNFVVWGGIHGLGRAMERKKKVFYKLKWFRYLSVFTFCTICWVFFRAESLYDVYYIFSHAFNGMANIKHYVISGFADLGIGWFKLTYLVFLLSILILYDYASLKGDVIKRISQWPFVCRWGAYIFICLIVVLFSQKGTPEEFIYFQF